MRRALKVILLVILALILVKGGFQPIIPASQFLQLVSDPEVKGVQKAAFMVRAKHPGSERLGTGMAIAEGLLLTAFHLVGNPNTGEITAEEIRLSQAHLGRMEELHAKVAKADPALDLAVLKPEVAVEVPPLSFGDVERLQPGEFIYAVGHEFFPGGIGVIYPRDGKIMDGLKEGVFFAIFPPVARGFSGGGVFNRKHELVGIVSRNFILLRTSENGKQVAIHGTMVIKINRALQFVGEIKGTH